MSLRVEGSAFNARPKAGSPLSTERNVASCTSHVKYVTRGSSSSVGASSTNGESSAQSSRVLNTVGSFK